MKVNKDFFRNLAYIFFALGIAGFIVIIVAGLINAANADISVVAGYLISAIA